MARWTDLAQWQGPAADNFGDGDWSERESADRISEHRGLVIHIAEGSYAGTVAWERNPGSDISSHFVAAKDGRLAQLVDTDDRPWTQGDGNSSWLSVECEGYAGQQLTGQQVEALAQLLARAHQVYGVPLQLADSPSGRGLGWHGMGGAAWGGHYQCPGAPIVAQRPAIIARAVQIVTGAGAPAPTVRRRRMMLLKDRSGTSIVLTDWHTTQTPNYDDCMALKASGIPYAEVSPGLVAAALSLPRPGAAPAPQPLTVELDAAAAAAIASTAAEVIGSRCDELETAVDRVVDARRAAASAEAAALAP